MGQRPPEVVSKNMSRIRSSDTEIEKIVRSKLWSQGYRYRKNYSKLPGKPDIVFTREKVAVFCDSDFWHGREWATLKKRLRTNSDYWIPKIEKNRKRDAEVSLQLGLIGWKVLRFWETDIKKDCDSCIREITSTLEERRTSGGK